MSTLSCHFNQNYNEQTIVSDYMPEKPLAIFLRRIFKECQKKIPFQTTAKNKEKKLQKSQKQKYDCYTAFEIRSDLAMETMDAKFGTIFRCGLK